MKKFTRKLKEDVPFENPDMAFTGDISEARACRDKVTEKAISTKIDPKMKEIELEIGSLKTAVNELLSKFKQLAEVGKSQTSPRSEGPTCYNCGKRGHIAKFCKKRGFNGKEAENNGQKVERNGTAGERGRIEKKHNLN